MDVKGLGPSEATLAWSWGRGGAGQGTPRAAGWPGRSRRSQGTPSLEELADGGYGSTRNLSQAVRRAGDSALRRGNGPDQSCWVTRPRGPGSQCELDLSCGYALSSHPGLAQKGPVNCGPSCPSGTRIIQIKYGAFDLHALVYFKNLPALLQVLLFHSFLNAE